MSSCQHKGGKRSRKQSSKKSIRRSSKRKVTRSSKRKVTRSKRRSKGSRKRKRSKRKRSKRKMEGGYDHICNANTNKKDCDDAYACIWDKEREKGKQCFYKRVS